jgi:hypothetical protein
VLFWEILEESQLEASLGKKVLETSISTNKNWERWCVSVIPAMQEA